ncbi:hypothetical protein RO179_000766 [Escherichia coli]|nr:hypothetical protein [Escherichia coli]
MKVKVNYFRATDLATGKRMAILVNEANYMFVVHPWCIADMNDDYRRSACRHVINMKGWEPRNMLAYKDWTLLGKYTVEFRGVF